MWLAKIVPTLTFADLRLPCNWPPAVIEMYLALWSNAFRVGDAVAAKADAWPIAVSGHRMILILELGSRVAEPLLLSEVSA